MQFAQLIAFIYHILTALSTMLCKFCTMHKNDIIILEAINKQKNTINVCLYILKSPALSPAAKRRLQGAAAFSMLCNSGFSVCGAAGFLYGIQRHIAAQNIAGNRIQQPVHHPQQAVQLRHIRGQQQLPEDMIHTVFLRSWFTPGYLCTLQKEQCFQFHTVVTVQSFFSAPGCAIGKKLPAVSVSFHANQRLVAIDDPCPLSKILQHSLVCVVFPVPLGARKAYPSPSTSITAACSRKTSCFRTSSASFRYMQTSSR